MMGDRRQPALIRAGRRLAGLGTVGRRVEQPLHGEVADQGPFVGIDDDAVGCQGAVGDAAPVRVVQGARDLLEDAQTGGVLEWSTGLQHTRERPAVDVLRRAPQEVLRGAVAVDRDDVRVIELRRRARRGVEALGRRAGLVAR